MPSAGNASMVTKQPSIQAGTSKHASATPDEPESESSKKQRKQAAAGAWRTSKEEEAAKAIQGAAFPRLIADR